MATTSWPRGATFRLVIETATQLNLSFDELFATLSGPDGFALETKGATIPGQGSVYYLEGPIPKDAPVGLYSVVKLELRRRTGNTLSSSNLKIPDGSDIRIEEERPTPPPDVVVKRIS